MLDLVVYVINMPTVLVDCTVQIMVDAIETVNHGRTQEMDMIVDGIMAIFPQESLVEQTTNVLQKNVLETDVIQIKAMLQKDVVVMVFLEGFWVFFRKEIHDRIFHE